ncbi:glyoxylate/hydroxypyruvate reductase A [Ideonella azotifigens]|uniref:Glyoxylate/hydroxypyruvate reductase A n=1 Tax=Ideonella azotifigens TaxID=513160 RepID=A0ABP3VEL8_9BURK|nr:glyoxylate/hydroxypyruvate reductase A [Ideonella azotifigens]MCD2344609.1 glyoxylate/hydroxypyruvate reductase A [Ideonella azotifigens]
MTAGAIPFVARAGDSETDAWVQALQQAMPGERVVRFDALSAEERATCTVAVVANPEPADLRQLPALQWVHSVWAGVERLVAELGDTPLKIVRLVDPQLADTMAEAVLAWTLYLHRDMPRYARQQAEAIWQSQPYVPARQRTVGLLGLGALGEAAARRLLTANFQVRGWSRKHKAIEGVTCFAGDDELQPMLTACDILVCLLPLTPQTTGLLNTERLAWLPRGAQLINFARGRIVDDEALRAALVSGQIAHAVLDVFATEPLPPSEWQWKHPGVTVLPHCSGPTDLGTAAAIVAGNVGNWRQTGELPPAINLGRGY